MNLEESHEVLRFSYKSGQFSEFTFYSRREYDQNSQINYQKENSYRSHYKMHINALDLQLLYDIISKGRRSAWDYTTKKRMRHE